MPRETEGDIAVIGMSCRVPGANSPQEFWDLLASSRDVQSKITRFNSRGFYHPDGGPRKGLTNVNKAYMLDDNLIDKFDNAFFYIPPLEAIAMDPQQRMLLEVAYEAVESGGIPLDDFTGTDTAVFAGMEGCEYHTIAARDLDATPRYLATGTPICMAANRISYFFDLSGPSMSVDTACSSAMAALHQAVRTLQHGDSKMAIVCGAKLILSPDMFMPSSELGFLSPTGRCHTFDAAADGYGRGEGVIAFLLKPLEEAIAAQDPIRAIIKGTRLNQDGKTQGITLPSANAQKRNMQALYGELGIPPADIQYLEAHGTGTAAGDPLEFSAINSVYGQSRGAAKPLLVGSVKSNIGHLEACSALGSIMKVILCLERAQIPPQMNFKIPNPKIDFRKVMIPNEMTLWPTSSDGIRRAAVNTFGAGGTNGHAVLETYSRSLLQSPITEKRPYLFKVSAADNFSLKQNAEHMANYVETSKPALGDLAHTMLSCRSTLRKSLFFTASSHEEVVAALRKTDHSIHAKPNEVKRGLIFLFTGQGAQWVQMGMSLVDHCPLFRCTLLECDRLLSELPDPPAWTIMDELSKPRDTSNIYKAEFSQPICTALQLSLVAVLESWGVTPDAVVGHSSGEICAAYAAGILSLRDAMTVSYYRGLVLGCGAAPKSKGSMCAVGLNKSDAEALTRRFSGRVQIAAINSPSSCTLSGNSECIKEIVEQLVKKRIFCRELKVDQAYHSHHMIPLAADYEDKLARANVIPLLENAKCAMYSSVYGRTIDASECSPRYWAQNMTSTVKFSAAFGECIISHPDATAIIEVGPHLALKGPARECLQSLGTPGISYLPTCMRGEDDYESLLSSAGAMIGMGFSLQSSNINAREIVEGIQCRHEPGNILTDAPGYQWNHSQSFWAESRVSHNVRFRKFPRHQLLGSRYVDDIPNNPCWRNRLMLKEIPWLQELKTHGLAEMPAAAYLLMALEAARQLSDKAHSGTDTLCLSDVRLERLLPLSIFSGAETAVEAQLIARQIGATKNYAFEIYFQNLGDGKSWTKHCSGKIETKTGDEPSFVNVSDYPYDEALMNQARTLEPSIGVGLKQLKLCSGGSSGEFRVSEDDLDTYAIDPCILNSILRLPPMSILSQRPLAAYHISSLASLTVSKRLERSGCGHFATRVKPSDFCSVECDSDIQHRSNTILLERVRYQVVKAAPHIPASNCLFFKPVLIPDITTLSASQPMSISRIAKVLTHKWPSCDIKINNVPECILASIVEAFGSASFDARSHFRSIECCSVPPVGISDRVRLVNGSDSSSKYHLIISQNIPPAAQLGDQLKPRGLFCCPKAQIQDLEPSRQASFEAVCDITGLDLDPWVLLRKVTAPCSVHANRRIVMFTNQRGISSYNGFGKMESVSLEPAFVARFCERNEFARFDAIVIDSPEKPVITSWKGSELIPWLQALLKSAESILWVTQDRGDNPFSNIAGSLLRTLQLEQPSLRVSWLEVNAMAEKDQGSLATQIEVTYIRMIEREDELVRRARGSEQDILRYMADDRLSAYTGLSLPHKVRSPMGEVDYSLDFATSGEPVVLSHKSSGTQLLSGDGIEVCVEASVLDTDDLHIFNGGPNVEVHQARSGLFFSGMVLKSQGPGLPPGSRVVGWHPAHVHRKKLSAQLGDVLPYPCSMQPSQAASRYAAMAMAACVVDGAARARRGETFLLDIQGPFLNAAKQICSRLGVSSVESDFGSKVDFVVTFQSSEGICINDKPVDIADYIRSDHGREMLQQIWQELVDLPLEIDEYEIADYKDAFKNAKQPYSTVLLHRNAAKIVDHVPVYKKAAPMFAIHAHYVVIGGLGGLGRFICSWMIENGAKHIAVISRSGAGTQEVRDAVSAMNASGASVHCIKADACDRKAISEILSKLRSECPIKGIINLAMVLGDAPMATMTAEEWDRVLHVKIDSSWILHEETLEDHLDFFILFSSIASVLGNRNQGNYNVANAALNALAEYRQSLDLPGISVALGAMTDMGVLYNLSQPNMLQTLSRSGLTHLTQYHLGKIMEAAVLESPRRDRSLLLTGLNMFERESDGRLSGRTEPLMWTDWPEFGHLQQYKLPEIEGGNDLSTASLKEQIVAMRHKGDTEQLRNTIRHAFLTFLSQLLGFSVDAFDSSQALNMYGIDSLSGVSCQYWFHKELEVDVSAGAVLGGDTIENIINGVFNKLTRIS